MNKMPYRHGLKLGLPLGLSLILTACGGGGSDAETAQPNAKAMGARMLSSLALGTSPEVALTPVGAVTTSSERGDLSAAAAIDGNEQTRWGSGFADDQSLTLDYGASQLITRVRIQWENAHATQYLLQVSEDNKTWTTIKTVDNSQGGTEDLDRTQRPRPLSARAGCQALERLRLFDL
jgi:hypothetical protein